MFREFKIRSQAFASISGGSNAGINAATPNNLVNPVTAGKVPVYVKAVATGGTPKYSYTGNTTTQGIAVSSGDVLELGIHGEYVDPGEIQACTFDGDWSFFIKYS